MENTYKKLVTAVEAIDNDDSNLERLEKAMQYYCGTRDKCEGYKHALITCLADQYQNHPEDQTAEHATKLLAILTN